MLGPVLHGKRGVRLAPFTLEVFLRYADWAGRPEVTYHWLPRAGSWTPQRLEEEHRKRAADPDGVHWTIEVDGQPAGYTAINGIDWVSRQGESFIFIGEHALYRRGVASEAVRLRTAFAFRELNLHRVYNWAMYENVGSRRANEKAGYRQRVLTPRLGRRGSRYIDSWGGEILRSDWDENSTG